MSNTSSTKMMISFILALVAYAIHYYMGYGQWCVAMWFGIYPPLFILIVTSVIYRVWGVIDNIREKHIERKQNEK